MVMLEKQQTTRPAIRSDILRAEFAPELGGRLSRLVHCGGTDVVVPLPPALHDPLVWPKAGAYPMLPYHNRIAEGRLYFAGETIPIRPHPDAAPHSLHGPAHLCPWRVVNACDAGLEMAIDYPADDDWPWPFEGRQRFALEGNRMTITLSVTNRSDRPMPAGLGWHPYVARCRQIDHDAARWWPHAPDYLPTGEVVSGDMPNPLECKATAYLSSWSHLTARLAGGLRLDMQTQPVFSHLVVHRSEGDYACIEPVTHLANGFNLAERGIVGTGTRVLRSGEMLSGDVTLVVAQG
ncbi:aldose 1-epimerase [Chelativorans alearense]|uniref:aldose epimerase family protein n=1 Tax=Chelativorans alearense TaxID=2681495 RepID=UPI0013D07F9E|nr:aldose 1-epimerase [Chelativorans alearense]